jgi:DUF4097 and DUF4098 domain-containing protein YvlB
MTRVTLLLTFALAVPSLAAQTYATDTTVQVERGSRLRVKTMSGDIAVTTWNRSELRIRADHSRRTELTIERSGAVVDVGARGRMGVPGAVDFQITAPTWMALELGGLNSEVTIDGTEAPVRVETLQGDIVLQGGGGDVTLGTTNGDITVRGARGRLDLRATAGDVRVFDVEGDLRVESVSGDAELFDVRARSVEAQTVSGDLVLSGSIADGGTYTLFTHSGDIVLGIPEQSNARLSLSSANGEFRLGFDLQAERRTRRRQTFKMGNGSATVELETFSGDIRVVRPDEVRRREAEQRDERRRPPRPPRDLGDDNHEQDGGTNR